METVTFKLREGFTRAETAAFGVAENIVIEAEQVYETAEQAVIDALTLHPAVVEIGRGIVDAVSADLDVLDPVQKGGKR